MPRLSRCCVGLLLVLLLLPAVAQAAEARHPAPLRSAASGWLAWDVLARLWGLLTGTQGDNGCIADPNGRCLPGQNAVPASDNGCRADPNGRCLPGQGATVSSDNGCRADPNGLCIN